MKRIALIGLVAVVCAFALVLILRRPSAPASAAGHRLVVIGAENEYANVLSTIGGPYVKAIGIMSNPNTDPHTYEASTADAREVASAALIVQNGLGYDSFMQKLEAASPKPKRVVLTVASIIGDPPSTPNPHLWYRPGVMAEVASRIASALTALEPSHKAVFQKNLAAFDASLVPWQNALTSLKKVASGDKVVVTEPVADYLLQAAGLDVATPWSFQLAVMNGSDPSPEDVATVRSLISQHQARVLVYNLQAVDSVTESLMSLAKSSNVPIVGVYETMPTGYTYARWMLTETKAVQAAIVNHRSEVKLP